MNHYAPLITHLLAGLVAYCVGSRVMYGIMRRKLDALARRFGDLRAAYQQKAAHNQELWLGQQRLFKENQELIRRAHAPKP